MDTVTQALLGGVVAYSVAGVKAPRKAILWGAAVAVLPDLDVFIPYDTDLDTMTFHRSWTHSWLVQTAVAPLMAALAHKFDNTFSFRRWWLMLWLVLVTHSGLDALTVYGTQLLWPFMPTPASGGSVFIIDPIYSLSLLLGFMLVLVRPQRLLSHKAMRFGFIFSCLYLLWGLGVQQWMTMQARQALAEQDIAWQQMQVQATALNTLLWRVLIIDEEYYYEGFRSVLDGDKPWTLTPHPKGRELADALAPLPAYQRMDWFTGGLMKLEQRGHDIIATDLRMGMEPAYFFRFRLAVNNDGHIRPATPDRVESRFTREDGVRWVWERIWNPAVEADFTPQLKPGMP